MYTDERNVLLFINRHPSSIFVEGNATVTVQVRNANGTILPGELSTEVRLV